MYPCLQIAIFNVGFDPGVRTRSSSGVVYSARDVLGQNEPQSPDLFLHRTYRKGKSSPKYYWKTLFVLEANIFLTRTSVSQLVHKIF